MISYSKSLEKVAQAAYQHGITVRFVEELPKSPRPTKVRGAFRMGEVLVTKENLEEALFVALHGIGHMAQWTLFPEQHKTSYFFNATDNTWEKEVLQQIWDHEWDALPYTLGFLQEHSLEYLADWYLQHFVADQRYLVKILGTGQYGANIYEVELKKLEQHPYRETVLMKSYPKLNLAAAKKNFICFL